MYRLLEVGKKQPSYILHNSQIPLYAIPFLSALSLFWHIHSLKLRFSPLQLILHSSQIFTHLQPLVAKPFVLFTALFNLKDFVLHFKVFFPHRFTLDNINSLIFYPPNLYLRWNSLGHYCVRISSEQRVGETQVLHRSWVSKHIHQFWNRLTFDPRHPNHTSNT